VDQKVDSDDPFEFADGRVLKEDRTNSSVDPLFEFTHHASAKETTDAKNDPFAFMGGRGKQQKDLRAKKATFQNSLFGVVPKPSPDFTYCSTLPPHSDASLDRPDLGRPRRDDERPIEQSKDDPSSKAKKPSSLDEAAVEDNKTATSAVTDKPTKRNDTTTTESLQEEGGAKEEAPNNSNGVEKQGATATAQQAPKKVKTEDSTRLDMILPDVVPSQSLLSAFQELQEPVWQFDGTTSMPPPTKKRRKMGKRKAGGGNDDDDSTSSLRRSARHQDPDILQVWQVPRTILVRNKKKK
jgi:hypothetical protein